MKTPSKTKPMLLFSLSLLALLALVPYAAAQDEAPMQEDMQAKMEQHHQQMMEHHQQMQEAMKAEMATLDSLVEQMKAAEDHGEKIDAIAAVVEELVNQHKKHMGQRAEMMGAMGGHAMGGMPMGHPPMAGHPGHGGHDGMKCSHGDKPCPHCQAGDCPHKDGMACGQCKEGDCPHAKEGGECPHKADGKACPHMADGKCPHCAEGGECPHAKAGEACPHCDAGKACPHCKAGGECKHHGGDCPMGKDCPMKDKSMEQEEGAMASEGR